MSHDEISNGTDRQRIKNLSIQIEFMRDFIVWLCEVECDSTVTELEKEYEKWQEKQP